MRQFTTALGTAINADCFAAMQRMPAHSVDLILADLPYGTTQNKWDTVIPFEPMWAEFHRIAKPTAPIVLTARQPFTSALGASNIRELRYAWVWEKSAATGHLNARRMPMAAHEDVLVFSAKPHAYYPQGLQPFGRIVRRGGNGHNFGVSGVENLQQFTNYPRSIIRFASEGKPIHPTQKPVALFEYLIKTYSQSGDLVFDPTAGSLTTGVAAEASGRRWICCERDLEYFEKGMGRFHGAILRPRRR